MIVEVILIPNSNINKNKEKKEKKKKMFQIACAMKYWGTPGPPSPSPAAAQPTQRPPGRKLIRASGAMRALKIQKAVHKNLLALYGTFSLGFNKREKEDATEGIGAPDLQIHT